MPIVREFAHSDSMASAQIPPTSKLPFTLEPSDLRSSRGFIARAVFFSVPLLGFVSAAPPILFGALDSDVTMSLRSGGDSITQIIYVTFFALSLLLVSASLRRGHRIALIPPISLLIPLAWGWVSVLWSFSPELAFRRIAFTSIVVFTIVSLVRVLGSSRTLQTLFYLFSFLAIANWLAVIFFPGAMQPATGLEGGARDAWRGVISDKNIAGPLCALSALFFFHVAKIHRPKRVISILFGVITSGFLIMTQSKASIGFFPIALAGGFVFTLSYRHPRTVLATALVLVGAFATTWLLFGQDIATAFDQMLLDPTEFTGRSQIWLLATSFIKDHFFFGSGYGSFWAAGSSSIANSYGKGWVLNVPTAHNGYIDLFLQIGFFGFLLCIFFLIFIPIAQLSWNRFRIEEMRPLLASIVIFVVLHNLLESSFLLQANGVWMIFSIALVLINDLRIRPSILAISK